jgi:hypothetical protein
MIVPALCYLVIALFGLRVGAIPGTGAAIK